MLDGCLKNSENFLCWKWLFQPCFHFVFLKNHFSKQILDSENPVECIREMNKKIKAHYFVWGEVKKRKDGEEKYFFELDGYVVHKPVPEEVSQKISKDFSTLLPKKIEFFEKLQLKGFQISAEFVYLSIKYIVGVAAFVSTDIFLAEKLHKNLYLRFNEFKPLPSHLQEIRTNAYTLFIEETYLIALYYHSYGGESKIQKVKECLDLVFKHSPKHYGALLIKSQLDFMELC